MADIKITHPKRDDLVPHVFLACGRAKTNVARIRGEIKHGNEAVILATKQLCYVTKPRGGHKYLWKLLFRLTQEQANKAYRLTVRGYNSQDTLVDTQTQDFRVREAVHGPTITYPDDGHDIIGDELNEFLTYGSTTEFIYSVHVGTQSAEFIYDDPGESFWSATFGPLNVGTGTHPLRVLDITDQPRTIDVNLL